MRIDKKFTNLRKNMRSLQKELVYLRTENKQLRAQLRNAGISLPESTSAGQSKRGEKSFYNHTRFPDWFVKLFNIKQ